MIEQIRDQLDVAIDRVATQLVSVEPDEAMADRIASLLPDRSWRRLKPSPSNWAWLAPQFAAAAGVALFAFVLFSNRSTKEADPIAATPAPHKGAPYETVVPPTVVAAKAPTITQADNTFDRDFGLTPVAGPQEITVASIDIAPVIDVPPVQVAPIVLTDLPLAMDSPSPR